MARPGKPSRERTRQRPHRPHELGPRIFSRGRWLAADLRPWGGQRTTLRDPDAPGWPSCAMRRNRTEEPEVAERWKWAYVDLLRGATRHKHLKLAAPARSLERAVAEYLDHRTDTKEFNTVRNDRVALTAYLLALDDCPTTADVTPAHLQGLFNRLARDGYMPSTVASYHRSIASFFAWVGGANPAAGIELRDAAEHDAEPWSDDELAVLRKAADRLDARRVRDRRWPRSFRLLVESGVGTGGRRGELFVLDWSAFRMPSLSVRFTVQIAERGDGTKALKGKRNRTTLVLPTWWEYTKRRSTPARGRVLTPMPGQAPSYRYARDWASVLYKAADLYEPRRSWHTLRHTYARLFLELGGSLEQLQKSLGHESIVTTEQTYEHFTHDRAAESARRRIYGDSSGPLGRVTGTGRR